MAESNSKEWRITNAKPLAGRRLELRRYERWSESWDHDHCAACWAKFAEAYGPEIESVGYVTLADYPQGAGYEWVCVACFDELQAELGWAVAGPP